MVAQLCFSWGSNQVSGKRLRFLVLGICLLLLASSPLSIVASQKRTLATETEAYVLEDAPEVSKEVEAARLSDCRDHAIAEELLAGNITVSGHWFYEDIYSHVKPTRYARVELWALEEPDDVLLATTSVQSNGYYQFSPIVNNGSLTEGYDIYVKLWCNSYEYPIVRCGISQSNSQLPPIWCWSQTDTQYNVTSGYHDMGSWVVRGNEAECWAAYDTVVDAYFWLLNRTGWSRPKVSIAVHANESGADLNLIVLYWGDGWDRWVVLHEYGHCIQHVLRGPLGPAGGSDHWFDSEITPWQAFREGWADFFAQAVDNSTAMWGGKYHCGSIEMTVYADGPFGNGDYGDWDGDVVEGAIAQVLWDIFDGVSPSDYPRWDEAYGDYVSNGFDQLWHILKVHKADNITYFWEQWAPKDARIWAIFHHARILEPRNIAVTNISSSRRSITQGETAYVNITVQNQGDIAEIFNLTAHANEFVIGSLTNVSLESGMIANYAFSWNTTDLTRGDYTLSAQTRVFPKDLNLADDFKEGSIVTIVSPGHDVCIHGVAISRTISGLGFSLLIETEIRNFGSFAEAFNITVSANSTTIGQFASVFLGSGGSAMFTLVWNTTSFPRGSYTIEVSASTVANETSVADNTIRIGVFVTIPGDADGDFDVDILDIVEVTAIYGLKDGEAGFNPNVDWNCDGRINILDVTVVTSRYGQGN